MMLKKIIASGRAFYNLKVTKILNNIKFMLFQLLGKSDRLSSLYYFLFSGAFDREYNGVMHGILKYHGEPHSGHGTSFLLRRSIHRLEKGLLMKPRRDIFALEYIEDAVKSYNQIKKFNSDECGEVRWAHDVLKMYFSVTSSHPIIDRARSQFNYIEKNDPLLSENTPNIPYPREFNNSADVSYESLLALAYQRRSVRWYLQKPVPRELVDQALKVASYSPSACNRQPFVFRIFDEPDLVPKVASLPGGTTGFYQNFPMIIAVVGNLGAYFSERDRHLIYIDSSLASMSFMLALETLGLSSCAINWPDIKAKEKKIAELIGLTPSERVIMLISVGYADPAGLIAYSQKKELDLIRKYNL